MGKHIVYEGPSAKSDPSTELVVAEVDGDGVEQGKPYRLRKGVPVEVPDALASELLGGDSERLKGHKFVEAPSKKKAEPDPPASDAGPGGSGVASNPGGTVR